MQTRKKGGGYRRKTTASTFARMGACLYVAPIFLAVTVRAQPPKCTATLVAAPVDTALPIATATVQTPTAVPTPQPTRIKKPTHRK